MPPKDVSTPQHAAVSRAVGWRFVPVKFHARGGLGEVLLAEDTELGRHVALKRILGEAADNLDARRRFVLEAEITGRLEHPGVVPVYGLGSDPQTGQPCYAMRFISGKSLKSAIDEFHASGASFGSVAFRKLLACLVSVCHTVGFAHSRGVLHRDLKPANVMVGEFGETLVVDWGLAKRLGEAPSAASIELRPPKISDSATHSTADSGAATQTGSTLGTPGYMSPEQAHGQLDSLGPATDIYALGATLYHLLTGDTPLGDKPPLARTMLTVQGKVPPARTVNPRAPQALSAVCRKAMAVEPRLRYARAETLAAELECWLADEPVSCLREGAVTQIKRWVRHRPATVATTLAVVVVLGLAALGGVVLVSGQRSALAEKNDELARKNAEIAVERDRALAAERAAAQQRDRALDAEEKAAANFAEARKVLAACLDLARAHPVFLKPGMQEPRELLLRTAAPFHDRFAAIGGTDELRHQAALAKIVAGTQSAHTRSKPEAVELFRRAVVELRALVAANPTVAELRSELAACHHNLGNLLAETGDRSAAAAEFRESLRLLVPLVEQKPTPEHRVLLGRVHNALATLLRDQSDLNGTQDQYQAALAIQRALVAEFPDVASYQDDLAGTSNNVGLLYRTHKFYGEAERYWRQTLALRESLVERSPASAEYRAALAAIHTNLGVLMDDIDKRSEAEPHYRAALKLLRTLAEQNPAVLDYRAQLGRVHFNLGLLFTVLRKLPLAEAEFRASVDIWAELVKTNPKIVEFVAGLGHAQQKLAGVLAIRGDEPAAIELLRAAVAHFVRTERESPEVTEYGWILSNCRVDLAALLAKRDPPAAVEQLRLAGPRAREHVLRDDDFESLRSRPEVRALLAEWQKQPLPKQP